LRRKNKTDVKRFLYVPHYPSQLSHLWRRRKLALPWNAVIGRVLPQIVATLQRVAFCRESS
jgi:hypothetical protein